MEKRKVFLVEVELTMQMAVVAESEQEAEKLARKHCLEELENGFEFSANCRVIKPTDEIPQEMHYTLPWGVGKDDPRHNWSIEEWVSGKEGFYE